MSVFTVTGLELPSPEVSAAELATWQAEGGLFKAQVPAHLVRGMAASAISGCWLSQRARNHQGYIKINDTDPVYGGRTLHRVLAGRINGPIDIDMDSDHLCRFKSCCYPGHQESVQFAENQKRRLEAVGLERALKSRHAFGPVEPGWLADLVDGEIEGVIVTAAGPFCFDPETRMPMPVSDPLIDRLPPLPRNYMRDKALALLVSVEQPSREAV